MSRHLKIGDKAPDFEAISSSGKKISLKDFLGQKIVIYFYPKDDTPGCTVEACGFRDRFDAIKETDSVVFGVSPDDLISHQKFIAKFNLPFELICDEDKKIAKAYGTYVQKSMFGKKYMGIARNTFVIDEEGNIAKIYEKVDTKKHDKEVLSLLQNLKN